MKTLIVPALAGVLAGLTAYEVARQFVAPVIPIMPGAVRVVYPPLGRDAVEAQPYRWPDTAPPFPESCITKTGVKEECGWFGGENINGIAYTPKEVSPHRWQMVVDEAAMREMGEIEAHRRSLWEALQTRVLTEDEMTEVLGYGASLNIESNVPYSEEEKQKERNEAFAQQARLRAIAKSQGLPL